MEFLLNPLCTLCASVVLNLLLVKHLSAAKVQDEMIGAKRRLASSR